MPANRSEDWIVDATAPIRITEKWGRDADRLRRSVMSDSSFERERAPISIPADELTDNNYVYYSADEFAAMPRDPERLIEWLRTEKDAVGGESQAILNELYLGLPPADLRVALFKALALTPGWEVTARSGSEVTLTRSLQDLGSQSFVVDTSAGMIVRVFDSPWQLSGTLLPADEPGLLETFTTTVVDSAPIR